MQKLLIINIGNDISHYHFVSAMVLAISTS